MWRPFASSLVEHSLDSFIINYEKNKTVPVYTPKHQNINPFQLSEEDLEKRLDDYKKLRQKVIKQRRQITKNDIVYQNHVETHLRYKRKVNNKNYNKKTGMVRSGSNGKKTDSMYSEQEPLSGTGILRKNTYARNSLPDNRIPDLPPIKKSVS
jgi:hypothetical protein